MGDVESLPEAGRIVLKVEDDPENLARKNWPKHRDGSTMWQGDGQEFTSSGARVVLDLSDLIQKSSVAHAEMQMEFAERSPQHRTEELRGLFHRTRAVFYSVVIKIPGRPSEEDPNPVGADFWLTVYNGQLCTGGLYPRPSKVHQEGPIWWDNGGKRVTLDKNGTLIIDNPNPDEPIRVHENVLGDFDFRPYLLEGMGWGQERQLRGPEDVLHESTEHASPIAAALSSNRNKVFIFLLLAGALTIGTCSGAFMAGIKIADQIRKAEQPTPTAGSPVSPK